MNLSQIPVSIPRLSKVYCGAESYDYSIAMVICAAKALKFMRAPRGHRNMEFEHTLDGS
jgi:hypothetical protein